MKNYIYKKKETAINHLNKGKIFHDNSFNLWRDDFDVAMTAVRQKGWALRDVSDKLKNNYEIVMAAVQECGYAIEYASKELRNNHEIVKIAVKQDGFALRYASRKLKDNYEIVYTSAKTSGWTILYASRRFRNNIELALMAIKINSGAYKYISPKLRDNPRVLIEVLKKYNEVHEQSVNNISTHEDYIEFESTYNPLPHASPRLKRLCRRKDLNSQLEILEKLSLLEELEEKLPVKTEQNLAKKKFKI